MASYRFFLHCAQCFTHPSLFPFLFFFSSTILLFSLLNFFFFYSLLYSFIIPSPHSWIPSFSSILIFTHLLLIFDFPPPQFLLFSLYNLDFPSPPPPHLFYMFFHSQIHGLHIDPTSTLDSTFFQHCFGNSETAEGNNRNVMVVVVGKRNVEVVVYCFTIHEAVLKKSRWGRCRVDARSMYLWIEKYIE